jgi:hypothetical protein
VIFQYFYDAQKGKKTGSFCEVTFSDEGQGI